MPKREPTPPLADDTKYLSVMNPYPLHCNPVITDELLLFARWVTACIPQDDLTAVYYRPKSPRLLIIEVQKSCREINRFLGAHAWKEFLKTPSSADLEEQSKVFYCSFASEREVQKHGWKRLDVQQFWFERYNPSLGPFKLGDNYPKTTFCEVPPLTQAEFAPCRNLPVDVFPRARPLPVNRVIVPGSDLYVKTKQNGTYGVPKPAPPKPVASGNAWSRVVAPKPVRAPSSYAQSLSGSDSVELIMNQAHTLPPGLNVPPPGLGAPPGLSLPSSRPNSKSSNQNPPVRFASRAASSIRAPSAFGRDGDEEDEDEEEDYEDGFEPRASSVVSDITNRMQAVALGGGGKGSSRMGSAMSGTSASSSSNASPVKPVSNLWSDYPWSDPVLDAQGGVGDGESGEGDGDYVQAQVRVQDLEDQAKEEEEEENLWAGGQPKRATDWDKLICPVHLVKCSGTCAVISKIKAEKKREQENAARGGSGGGGDGEWREAKGKRGKAKGRNNSGGGGKRAGGGGGWH